MAGAVGADKAPPQDTDIVILKVDSGSSIFRLSIKPPADFAMVEAALAHNAGADAATTAYYLLPELEHRECLLTEDSWKVALAAATAKSAGKVLVKLRADRSGAGRGGDAGAGTAELFNMSPAESDGESATPSAPPVARPWEQRQAPAAGPAHVLPETPPSGGALAGDGGGRPPSSSSATAASERGAAPGTEGAPPSPSPGWPWGAPGSTVGPAGPWGMPVPQLGAGAWPGVGAAMEAAITAMTPILGVPYPGAPAAPAFQGHATAPAANNNASAPAAWASNFAAVPVASVANNLVSTFREMHQAAQRRGAPARGDDAVFVHPTATIHPGVVVMDGARVDAGACVRSGAFIGRSASIGRGAQVNSGAMVAEGAEIGEQCVIHSGACIGQSACVGARTVLDSGVQVCAKAMIGADCRLHSGCCVGTEAEIGPGATLQPGSQVADRAHVPSGSVLRVGQCVGPGGMW